MGRQVLVLEAHYTTHIEGTRLTLDKPKFKKPLGDMTHICDLEERLKSLSSGMNLFRDDERVRSNLLDRGKGKLLLNKMGPERLQHSSRKQEMAK